MREGGRLGRGSRGLTNVRRGEVASEWVPGLPEQWENKDPAPQCGAQSSLSHWAILSNKTPGEKPKLVEGMMILQVQDLREGCPSKMCPVGLD